MQNKPAIKVTSAPSELDLLSLEVSAGFDYASASHCCVLGWVEIVCGERTKSKKCGEVFFRFLKILAA